MCKGNLPEINFSDVKCTFRPRTSLGCANQNHFTLGQENESAVDFPRLRTKDSNHEMRFEKESATRKPIASHFFEEDLSLEGQPQIRPKTVKVTSRERGLCKELITLSFGENTKKNNAKDHHKREIVVFLPSEKPKQKDAHRDQAVLLPLPDIGARDTLKLTSGENFPRCNKTPLPPDEHAFPRNTTRHSIGLPLIGSPSQEKKTEKIPVRRVKSHDMESHLRRADKNFDKFEAKAFLVYNWMKTQNELETLQ